MRAKVNQKCYGIQNKSYGTISRKSEWVRYTAHMSEIGILFGNLETNYHLEHL